MMNSRDVTIITLWSWEKIRIHKTYEEYIELKQWQSTISIPSLRREINIKDIKSAEGKIEYIELLKQLWPPIFKELTPEDRKNRAKIIAKAKKMRDKKKAELEKDWITKAPIKKRMPHLWNTLEMDLEKEKELLDKLK